MSHQRHQAGNHKVSLELILAPRQEFISLGPTPLEENCQQVGDSVYAEWNPDLYGEHLVLTTENGLPSDPSNTILLGPQELQNLIAWAKEWGWKI